MGFIGSRRALCIGIADFGDDREDVAAFRRLPFVPERVTDVTTALTDLGYECRAYGGSPATATAVGAAVGAAITEGRPDDVQVVHVISHGHLSPSGVYIVGADGAYAKETAVAGWVADIEDFPDRAPTLFLIDTCHAGAAARLDWLRAADEETRAWVIAATTPNRFAYDGRFSQAAARVFAQLAAGEIDFYPAREFVPFGDVVEHIRREVAQLGGQMQRVYSTPVDGRPAPPFFPNRRPPTASSLAPARDAVDATALPFLDLDVALDPAHFLDRAAGHRTAVEDLPDGCFTGRVEQLRQLTEWLTAGAGGLRVVTGGPGSGKSALLGIVVCTAHPRLRAPTGRLWRHLDGVLPEPVAPIAAIHLRERGLADAVGALSRQLALAGEPTTVDGVLAAVAALPCTPLVIVDAVDEAVGQVTVVDELLLPLARSRRPDGTPACRLLVGMRPWEEFQPLSDLAAAEGGLIDLDQVPVARLRAELGLYVEDLLRLSDEYAGERQRMRRRVTAQDVAETLTAPGRERGGEFLAAALYTNWLVNNPPGHPYAAIRPVPRDVSEVLELDLATGLRMPWLRPVLTAIAHAYGAGMPATVIRRLARVFLPADSPLRGQRLTVAGFDDVLRQVRFYLRSSPDTDGTTLYRLFHQGLVDRLRDREGDLDAFVDALLEPVPTEEAGGRRWEAAEPYVVRHGLRHAVDAGRLDELIDVDPERLHPVFNATLTQRGRMSAAIVRETAKAAGPHASREKRRQLLVFNAACYGVPELAERLLCLPGLPPLLWSPRWSTSGDASAVASGVIDAYAGRVRALAGTRIGDHAALVAGLEDGSVWTWDLDTGEQIGRPLTGHAETVRAVACTRLGDRPVAVTGSDDETARIWDLRGGRQVARPLEGHDGAVLGVACAWLRGRPVAVTASYDETVRIWDLDSGRQIGPPLRGHRGAVTALACTELDGRPIAVTGGADETVRIWDLDTGARTDLGVHSGPILALACTNLDGRPVAVVGCERTGRGSAGTRTLWLWDLGTRSPVDEPLTGHPQGVWAVACTELGGRPVAVTAGGSSVRLWDLTTREQLTRPLSGHTGSINSVACVEVDGRPVALTGSFDGTVRIWEVAAGGGRSGQPRTGHVGGVQAVAVARANGHPTVVTGGFDKTVRVWSGEHDSRRLDGHDGGVLGVACTELAGRSVAVTAGGDNTVRIWDLTTYQPLGAALRGHTSGVRAVACTRLAGRAVAVTGSYDETVRVWDLTTYEQVGPALRGHTSGVRAVACASFGGRDLAVTGSHDGTVRMWDLRTGEQWGRSLHGHRGAVLSVACTELRGQCVAVTGGSDHQVRFWNLATGQQLHPPLDAHAGAVRAVACLTLDGRPVAVTGGDRTIRFWGIESQEEVETADLPFEVHALAVAGGGELFVAFGTEVANLHRNHDRGGNHVR